LQVQRVEDKKAFLSVPDHSGGFKDRKVFAYGRPVEVEKGNQITYTLFAPEQLLGYSEPYRMGQSLEYGDLELERSVIQISTPLTMWEYNHIFPFCQESFQIQSFQDFLQWNPDLFSQSIF